MKHLGVLKIEKIAKNVDFWHIFNFFQVFRCFHARRSAKKLFLVKNASILTPWWPIFRNPGGIPGCLFLLHRFYTGNFAFLSEKIFLGTPQKNFFTGNIGHALSYRLVSWSTDFSTLGVFKIAKWWKSTFCQFFFIFFDVSDKIPEHRNLLSKKFFYRNVPRSV